MSKSTKIRIAAAAGAAVAVAGGGAAVAASKVWSPKAENQAVLDDAAKQLGISSADLSAALQRALEDRVDAAVEAGRLTKAQGDALKARIEAGGAPFALGGFGPGGFGRFGHPGNLDAAASYLGLSEEQLANQLASGKTLADVAKAQGKSVDGLVQALVKGAETKIDALVTAGRLTAAQADKAKSTLQETMTALVNGTFHGDKRLEIVPGAGRRMFGPSRGFGFHGFRPGQGFRAGDFGSPPPAA